MKEITIKKLAKTIKRDPSTLVRFIDKNKIPFTRKPNSIGQARRILDEESANKVIAHYSNKNNFIQPNLSVKGIFYICQIAPDMDEGRNKFRIKLGISRRKGEERMRDHLAVLPTAKLLKTFNCNTAWERAAIDFACNDPGCVAIGTELYDVDNLEKLLTRVEQFFKMMPAV